MIRIRLVFAFTLVLLSPVLDVFVQPAIAQGVGLKSIGRFDGWRDNALVGQGIVIGLSGTGDSSRSAVTKQALKNAYSRLGIDISEGDINTRNVAVVMISATLPPSANVGDKIEVRVSSTGDARSLAGGVLLMAPLVGPDQQTYALAQGPLVSGGHSFESQLNLSQRNYPTTASLIDGATVERAVHAQLLGDDGYLRFFLNDPNFTTATRVANSVNQRYGKSIATAMTADEVVIYHSGDVYGVTSFVSALENIQVQPDQIPKIIVSERTGTVVAGADVRISSVVIAQGDVRITVKSEREASQPAFISGFATGVNSLVVTNTELEVDDNSNDIVAEFGNTTIADLVQGLNAANVETNRIISILHAIKAAGALHAEIIVQ